MTPLVLEVDLHPLHAVELSEGSLDLSDTRLAGHALDSNLCRFQGMGLELLGVDLLDGLSDLGGGDLGPDLDLDLGEHLLEADLDAVHALPLADLALDVADAGLTCHTDDLDEDSAVLLDLGVEVWDLEGGLEPEVVHELPDEVGHGNLGVELETPDLGVKVDLGGEDTRLGGHLGLDLVDTGAAGHALDGEGALADEVHLTVGRDLVGTVLELPGKERISFLS